MVVRLLMQIMARLQMFGLGIRILHLWGYLVGLWWHLRPGASLQAHEVIFADLPG